MYVASEKTQASNITVLQHDEYEPDVAIGCYVLVSGAERSLPQQHPNTHAYTESIYRIIVLEHCRWSKRVSWNRFAASVCLSAS